MLCSQCHGMIHATYTNATLAALYPTLGQLRTNAHVVRAGLPCEPCWFGGARFRACMRRIDCLRDISVDRIERDVRAWHHARGPLRAVVMAPV